MIEEMRREFGILAAVLALALLPSPAHAQEWEDAPADESTQTVAPAEETTAAAPEEYEDKDPAALTDFNKELAPYGQWRNDPTYGTVWVPNQAAVGADFAPYVTSGHWAMADDGSWIWVSDLKFGWVVFHYGRWVWINNVGWAWIPGRRYAHAWVVWRVGDPGYEYVGWAPMPPDYIWVNGYAVGVGFGVYTSWVFCPSAYVYHHHVHTYVIHDHAHVHRVAAHTHRYSGGAGVPAWHGPPPKKAHIPAKAVPKKRTAADPKAIAASVDKRPPSAKKVKKPGSAPSTASAKARPGPTPLRTTRTLPGTSSEPLRSSRPSSSASLVPRTSGPTRSGTPLPPTRSSYPAPAPRQYSARPAPSSSPRSAPAPTRSATPSRSAPQKSSPSRSHYRPAPPPPSRSFSPSPPPRPSHGSSPAQRGGGGRRR
jgi:hypothetical protein